jgi:DNA polymerase alpha subunit B
MFTSLIERAKALDKHLIRLQEDMCRKLMITDALQPVGIPSQENVWVCGRICCDSEGKINKESVLLEGSRTQSGGRRVMLELKEVPAFSLFPGQIVMVEGVNSTGRKMTGIHYFRLNTLFAILNILYHTIIAKQIFEGIPRPLPQTPPTKLLEYHHSTHYQNGLPLNVMIASGPFTTIENLSYEPFHDLLIRVIDTKPDLLILIGPFVDVSQPLLASGKLVVIVFMMKIKNCIFKFI